MKSIPKTKYYPPKEEKINIVSHTIGIILSIIALVLLIVHSIQNGNIWHIISFTIFGICLLILYTASTIYHSSKKPELRNRLRVFDHSAIYVLIAGSYTPFTLVTLNGQLGWLLFGVAWSIASIGIILKLFFTGRFKIISTLMYIFMGWIMVFAINPLISNLPSEGLYWLFAGGMAYTIGAVLYSIKKIKFNHAIFHILVVVGSFCHFISIYFYVLPH